LGTFHASPWLAFLAATTLITGAAYTLWMIKRVVFGEIANDHVAALTDVSAREFWMLMVLAIAVLLVGIWPAPLVDAMDASIGELLIHVGQPKL
jgi:NADH-quinone oxidoreductase subunit M